MILYAVLIIDADASSTRLRLMLLASVKGNKTEYRTKKTCLMTTYYFYYHFSNMTTNL